MCAAPIGNKFALGLTTNGQPPKYDSPEEFTDKVVSYFDWCQGEYDEQEITVEVDGVPVVKIGRIYTRNPEKLTVTGMALYLGFASRQSIYDYVTKEDFSYVIKRALMVIENKYESMLDSKSVTGAIFALKNMGWKDKTEVEQTLKDITPPSITFSDSASDDVE
jgi:hypothetical protein